MNNQEEIRKNIKHNLHLIFKDFPSRNDVEEKAIKFGQLFNYTGNIQNLVDEFMTDMQTRMGVGISIVDRNADHDEQWVQKRKDIAWTYANAYTDYLKRQGWSPRVVESIRTDCRRILGHMQNPATREGWSRRGLVIGHVQSGKTANYTGLLAHAADAGYKCIIVIAGIHNNLRKQTQERIEEGFVGRTLQETGKTVIKVGVGAYANDYPEPVTITTIRSDFNKQTAERSGWKLNDFRKPVVLVIKKNVYTLESLLGWLKDLNSVNGRITDVPLLMIDDEADNASINTNRPELDPTRTNRLIRRILGLFDKSCYIGYTATPFANIFIDPDAYDEEDRKDLFPKDFIYLLDKPTDYFGPDMVFGNDDDNDDGEDEDSFWVREIDDAETWLPIVHKKNFNVTGLPDSLYRAFRQFVLVRAIRNCRNRKLQHCSMLVNVSRFVDVQKQVRYLLSEYKERLQNAVLANYALQDNLSDRDNYMYQLHTEFNVEFMSGKAGENMQDNPVTWQDVKRELPGVLEDMQFCVINSKSDEILDYKRAENDGNALTVVAVGGLSLSRGLTLEGLCISYMYRNTRMYDTLMQMGRWFGYRYGYQDLCRIWLNRDSIGWYSHITDKTNELRAQIREMRKNGMSPEDFGLFVGTHPDNALLITARNKMRSGKTIKIGQYFGGRLIESTDLSADTEICRDNENLVREFMETGFGGIRERFGENLFFRNVSISVVENFLRRFKMATAGMEEDKKGVIDYLVKIADDYPEADVLCVSTQNRIGNHILGVQERRRGWEKDENGIWRTAKRRIGGTKLERYGLSDEQLAEAGKLAQEAYDEGHSKSASPSDVHYRKVRRKPLLMIHLLKIRDEDCIIPAFGISFPLDEQIRHDHVVVVNKVWLRQDDRMGDSPENEDDYDE